MTTAPIFGSAQPQQASAGGTPWQRASTVLLSMFTAGLLVPLGNCPTGVVGHGFAGPLRSRTMSSRVANRLGAFRSSWSSLWTAGNHGVG